MTVFQSIKNNSVFTRVIHSITLIAVLVAMMPRVAQAEAMQSFVGVKTTTAVFAQDDMTNDAAKSVFPMVEDRESVYDMWVVATAYSSDPWQTDSTPCRPAEWNFDMCEYFEKYGVENTIAANFLPLGAQVKFPELYGDKVFVVRDRMNARYNGTRRIDFWIGSETPENQEIIREAKNKARQFGVKQLKMEVYSM